MTAERNNRDDDADVELRALFRAVPHPAPSSQFSGRVADAIARDVRRRARIVRLAAYTLGAAGLLATAMLLLQLPRLFRPIFHAGVGGLVWSLTAVDRGLDVWSLLGNVARVAAAIVVTPQATLLLMALAVVAIAALYGLNRVLELEERSSS